LLDKFDSGTGWASFTKAISKENVVEKSDRTLGWSAQKSAGPKVTLISVMSLTTAPALADYVIASTPPPSASFQSRN